MSVCLLRLQRALGRPLQIKMHPSVTLGLLPWAWACCPCCHVSTLVEKSSVQKYLKRLDDGYIALQKRLVVKFRVGAVEVAALVSRVGNAAPNRSPYMLGGRAHAGADLCLPLSCRLMHRRSPTQTHHTIGTLGSGTRYSRGPVPVWLVESC